MARATMSLGKALNAGLRQAMEHDPKVVLMGEDIGKLGGVFRVTEGLQADFGDRRVIDTPLAESGVIGTAVGLAIRGFRPVCEIQFDGFVYPAFDQIVSQVAKIRFRNEGRVAMPLTIRVPYGGGIGTVEHHSESPEAYFAHTAGLRVVTPSNPADGLRMMRQAIASDDPVVFFEPKRRYWDKGEVDPDEALRRGALAPGPGGAGGSDVTVAAYGPMVATALRAARLAAEEGTSVEVLDLRSLSPIDFDIARDVGAQDGPARRRRTRHLSSAASAPKSPPASRSAASTTWRRRCGGWAASPRPTRRPSSSATSCPTPTASSTRSTACLDAP